MSTQTNSPTIIAQDDTFRYTLASSYPESPSPSDIYYLGNYYVSCGLLDCKDCPLHVDYAECNDESVLKILHSIHPELTQTHPELFI